MARCDVLSNSAPLSSFHGQIIASSVYVCTLGVLNLHVSSCRRVATSFMFLMLSVCQPVSAVVACGPCASRVQMLTSYTTWCRVVLPRLQFHPLLEPRNTGGATTTAAVQVHDGRFLATQSRLLQRGCVVHNCNRNALF